MCEKHMFAGVNAPGGFVSRFDYIMPETLENRKIFIKGAPGTGKSTLMKKIAERAIELGMDCEIFHCSSDPSSYDAVHIPALNTAICDATAPHTGDPVYPKLSGEIYDITEHISAEKLKPEGEAIAYYSKKKKRCFARGYYFLSAALPLIKQAEEAFEEIANTREIKEQADLLVDRIVGRSKYADNPKVRKLFLSAITPEGFINFADSVFSDTYCVALSGEYAQIVFTRRFIEKIIEKGISPTVFYCPMQPIDKPEHIFLPELRVALISKNYQLSVSVAETIMLDNCLEQNINTGKECIYTGALMQNAIDAFAEAREAHTFLEKIYIKAMDFDSLDRKNDALIKSIFK